jgi:hypothetical protein
MTQFVKELSFGVGQRLQDDLELLPGVDRAFVHLDWEGGHAIEHSHVEKRKTSTEKLPV